MLILFPIDITLIVLQRGFELLSNVLERICWQYDDYVLKPSARICTYAIRIMKSDKILQRINEYSKILKQGKPID